ncbi:MAG: hypothetical protein AAFP03_15190 [Cyanobacteria bacterium J06598_3]
MAAKSKETLLAEAQSATAQTLIQKAIDQKNAKKSASEESASVKGSKETQASAQPSSAKATSAKTSAAKTNSAKTSAAKTNSAKTNSAKTSAAKKTTKKETTKKGVTKATAAQKEQARKARAGARIAEENSQATRQAMTPPPATPSQMALATANPSELASAEENAMTAHGDSLGIASTEASIDSSFLAANYTSGDIWSPNAAIPAIDEATYHARKTQAEGQRRAIEVANLNLKNINDLQQLESQHVEVAISAKTTETRAAQLAGADIDYQRQVELNGEKSQQLMQASAKHEAATRETGYTRQLIDLKDQNFDLEIQQAQTVFAQKAARYRAQLTGQ